jgi:hypothetical protein
LQHQQLHQQSQNQLAASQFHGFTVKGGGGRRIFDQSAVVLTFNLKEIDEFTGWKSVWKSLFFVIFIAFFPQFPAVSW